MLKSEYYKEATVEKLFQKHLSLLRNLIALGIIVFGLGAFCGEVWADDIYDVQITIQIPTEKHGGSKWDRLSGAPPDVYGMMLFPSGEHEIPLHQNTSTLSLSYKRVPLNPGDTILMELFDRDRFRNDDQIGKGTLTFEGQEVMKIQIGFALVTFHFVKR